MTAGVVWQEVGRGRRKNYEIGDHKTMRRMILCLGMLSLGVGTSLSQVPTQYEDLLNALSRLEVDQHRAVLVLSYTFRSDVASFTLHAGTIYPCALPGARLWAAMFVGDGTFLYTPPTDIERKQLIRFYNKEALNEKFSSLFLIMSDSTIEQWLRSFPIAPAGVPLKVNNKLRSSMKYLIDGDRTQLIVEIAKTLLEGEQNGLFFAHVETDDIGPVFF